MESFKRKGKQYMIYYIGNDWRRHVITVSINNVMAQSNARI